MSAKIGIDILGEKFAIARSVLGPIRVVADNPIALLANFETRSMPQILLCCWTLNTSQTHPVDFDSAKPARASVENFIFTIFMTV